LRRSGSALDLLLLTSAPEAAYAGRPSGCDIVSIPALAKDERGRYHSRHLSVGSEHLIAMRQAVLHAALASFAPDVLIVDKHARGFRGELEPALEAVRQAGGRVVLGLRDVLDDASVTVSEWKESRTTRALRNWYDEVWVYGDRRVHDPLEGIKVPGRVNVRYAGYLAHGRHGIEVVTPISGSPYVLAMVGAGSDGAHLARAFARAAMPEGHRGVIVSGPHMPEHDVDELRRLASGRPELRIVRSAHDAAALISGAAALVGMGGYNTVCEALAAATPMLVVPRIAPRREQLVRARALEARGAVDVLDPRALSSETVAAWAARATTAHAARAVSDLDLSGLARIPDFLADLVGTHRQESRHAA
jgi:predicted glycosyltransferase